MLESLFNKVAHPQICNFIKKETPTQVFSCEISNILRTHFSKNTSGGCFCTYCTDVTCNLSRWNNEYNDISIKKRKHFEKIGFLNKFYINFHFVSLCAFISIQNIDRSIPLRNCSGNLQPQMPKLKFLKTLIFPIALQKLQN